MLKRSNLSLSLADRSLKNNNKLFPLPSPPPSLVEGQNRAFVYLLTKVRRERERGRETERKEREKGRETERRKREGDGERERERERQRQRQRQTDRQTDRQRQRQTDRQTETDRWVRGRG